MATGTRTIGPGNPSIDQVPLKKEIVLGGDGKDYGRVFAPLGFMD